MSDPTRPCLRCEDGFTPLVGAQPAAFPIGKQTCPTCKGDGAVVMKERRKNRSAAQYPRRARKKKPIEPIDPAVREADAKKLVQFLVGHPCKHRGEGHGVKEIGCPMCVRAAILAFAAKWADGRGVADVFRLHTAEALAKEALAPVGDRPRDTQLYELARFLHPDPKFVHAVRATVEDNADILKGLEDEPELEPESIEGLETCQLHGLEFSSVQGVRVIRGGSDWEMCQMGCSRGIPS